MLAAHTSTQPAPCLGLRRVGVKMCINPNAFGNALGSSLAEANSGTRIDKTKPLTAEEVGKVPVPDVGKLLSELPQPRFADAPFDLDAALKNQGGIVGSAKAMIRSGALSDLWQEEPGYRFGAISPADRPYDRSEVLTLINDAGKVRQATPLTSESVARHIDVLRSYAEKGERENYWNYLADQGVQYAQLALGVVRNDTLNGAIANGYAQMRAMETGVSLTERGWNDVGVTLIQKDLEYRETYAKKESTYNQVLELPVKDIAAYHTATFKDHGLDEYTWTAHIPLAPYLEKGDYAGAEQVWKTMMDERFYVSAPDTAWGEAKAVYNGPHNGDHAMWLGKVALLTAAYVADPLRAYTDPNKIGEYQFNGEQWSKHSVNYMDRGINITLPINSTAAQQLNSARDFRIENWVERVKNPLDQSTKMRSR